ncbi:hypothetical protein [Sphingopyxis sp. NFH-91]|uniref:hypothetical protein n=1 Tax=Sphingopyxis sp. NFH-91 TaxID=2744457 RepID=UPI001F490FCF|nr:hypothetical protein [Sphingopyxis sp. NFH-91]
MKNITMLLALALAGCSGGSFSDAERDEIGDIAGDAASAAVSEDESVQELKDKVDELELRLQDVEARLNM